jgi:citrate lyase beta subunit
VLAAAEGAAGVFALDGRMIDEPLLRQARRVRDAARRVP